MIFVIDLSTDIIRKNHKIDIENVLIVCESECVWFRSVADRDCGGIKKNIGRVPIDVKNENI